MTLEINTNNKSQYLQYLLLAIFIFFSFYFAIGSYPLFDNNEGLYSNIGKLMLLNKNFIIPYLNCVPYIEKPPLLYWLLSLSFSTFDFTAFAARFVTTSAATFLCAAILYFTKKINLSKTGVFSVLIFSTSIGISIISRMVYFDMLFTLFVSLSLFSLFYWYESQKKSALRIGYAMVGFAVLTKGLIAIILVAGSFIAFLAVEKKLRSHFIKLLDPLAIILFLAIVLPWHIAATLKHKGFAWHYFIEEHFLRFLSQREPHDYYQGPIYYYLPRIMIYIFPWSIFTPLIFHRDKNLAIMEKKLINFAWCWLLIPLIFFSLSKAKANYYMVVSMPALAIILGIKIKRLISNHNPKILTTWITTILLTVAIGMTLVLFYFANKVNISPKFIIATIIYCVVASVFSIYQMKKPMVSTIALGGLIIPIVFMMISYIKTDEQNLSAAKVGIYLNDHAKGKPLYLYQEFEDFSALSFYAPSCFKIIDTKSHDLYYGAHLSKYKYMFVDNNSSLKFSDRAYIIVPNKKLSQFYQNPAAQKLSILKTFDKLTILKNP